MNIIITSKGVELTPVIENYVAKKMEGVTKFFQGIVQAEIMLGLENHHHLKGDIFFAEGKLLVPGTELFSKKQGSSLYESVDLLRDHLVAEIKKYKGKLEGKAKKKKISARQSKEYQA